MLQAAEFCTFFPLKQHCTNTCCVILELVGDTENEIL